MSNTRNPTGDGTGPAGRRLLAAIDRHTSVDNPVARFTHVPRGRLRLGYATFNRATVRRLVDAGLVTWADPDDPSSSNVELTAAGRTLLGA